MLHDRTDHLKGHEPRGLLAISAILNPSLVWLLHDDNSLALAARRRRTRRPTRR